MKTGCKPFQRSDARMSLDDVYRYDLRRWDEGAQRELAIIMLNPSTADAYQDDPTIRKCVGFARAHGFDGIHVVNLFAYRATAPAELKRQAKAGFDVVGPGNDECILEAVQRCRRVIVAWGNHGSLQGRDQAVLKLLQDYNLECLGPLSKQRQPQHPLMLSYALPLMDFDLLKAQTV